MVTIPSIMFWLIVSVPRLIKYQWKYDVDKPQQQHNKISIWCYVNSMSLDEKQTFKSRFLLVAIAKTIYFRNL
jgi:hypothetical protein